MRLADYMHARNVRIEPWVELYNKKVMSFTIDEGGDGRIMLNPNIDKIQLSEDAAVRMMSLASQGFMQKLEAWFMQELIGDGPKIFRPTAEQLFALERMTVNLSMQEFASPFPIICVEFPEEYAAAKNFGGKQPSLSLFYTAPDKRALAHNVFFEQYSLKSWVSFVYGDNLERWLEYDYTDDVRLTDIPVDQQEYVVEQQVRRAVMNYCLLLDEVGIKQDGPEFPNEYAQLVKWASKKTIHTPRNKAQLQASSFIYSLARRPTDLVRVVKTAAELPATFDGQPIRTVSPHSRRGHYRMQAYGVGRAERKRIRVPPTIINKHLLLGGPPGGTYTT